MRAAGIEVRAEGVVRIMHPDKGMGVEFKLSTAEHRVAVEKFLAVLTENRGLLPELLVQPEGLETGATLPAPDAASGEDPLLQLFYGEPLSADNFHEALREQRGVPLAISQSPTAGAQA